jgi:hypothetical protein
MKQSFFKKLSNSRESNSFSNKLRRKRIKNFENYFTDLLSDRKVEILDVGEYGITENKWVMKEEIILLSRY